MFQNLNARQRLNTLLTQRNINEIASAADTVKDAAAQTFLGAGVLGAADMLRQIMPYRIFPSILGPPAVGPSVLDEPSLDMTNDLATLLME